MLDRKDLPSAGAGECPMIGLAPAIANAIFDATKVSLAIPAAGSAGPEDGDLIAAALNELREVAITSYNIESLSL